MIKIRNAPSRGSASSFSSIYSILWLLGDLHAARLNPSLSTDRGLHLRTGLRWRADLSWADIETLLDDPPEGRSVSMTLFGKPDLWLQCRDEVLVGGPFGIERRVRVLGLGLDDPAEFRRVAGPRITGREMVREDESAVGAVLPKQRDPGRDQGHE